MNTVALVCTIHLTRYGFPAHATLIAVRIKRRVQCVDVKLCIGNVQITPRCRHAFSASPFTIEGI